LPREQRDRLRELALGRVDPADQHVQDEVLELDVGEPVALLLGGDQRGDQVVGGRRAPVRDQRANPGVELPDLRVDPRERLRVRQRDRVELALDPHRPVVQPRRVLARRAHHGRDRQRRVRLGDRLDEVALAAVRHRAPQLLEEAAHRRAVAVGGHARERGADQLAQAPVVVAVDVDDVARDLLVQRALGDAEQLGDLEPREDRCLGLQEVLAGGPVEHDRRQRRAREPVALGELAHRGMEALAAQLRVHVVELG